MVLNRYIRRITSADGKFNLVTAIFWALIIGAIYAAYIGIPLIKQYYEIKQDVYAQAYSGRVLDDYRIRTNILATLEKQGISAPPSAVRVSRITNPAGITITVEYTVPIRLKPFSYTYYHNVQMEVHHTYAKKEVIEDSIP